MSLFKDKSDKVILEKQEYINNQIEMENLKYKWFCAQEYVANHKVLDRAVIGSLLGIPENIMKGE